VISIKIIRFLNAIGLFNSIKPLETALLAKAMINATKSLDDGTYAFTGPEIIKLASK
jgi:hypothetical protein